jgi:hypothetical protein
MAVQDHGTHGEWRLGTEPAGNRIAAEPVHEFQAPEDASHRRLERSLIVLTTERLGWMLVIAYAAASRLIMLGRRPLNAAEASRTLAALNLGAMPIFGHGHPQPGIWLRDGWIGLADAVLMRSFGPDDAAARLMFALSGVAIVALAFALRNRIGRAGALGTAACLALSPGLTWFSRSAVPEIPAILLLFATILMFFATIERPHVGRAIALGCFGGLALGADPSMISVGAIFAIAMIVIGIWMAVTTPHPWIDVQIWWRRQAVIAIVAAGFAILTWTAQATALFTRPIASAMAATLPPLRLSLAALSVQPLIPFLPGVYEFLVVLIGFAALAIVAAWRVRSHVAAFVTLWAIGIAAFTLLSPVHRPAAIVQIILPVAILCGIGLDWLHHTRAWGVVRYPIAAIALLTIWVQILTSFTYPAPNPAEPNWARHATLFWVTPATTAGVPEELARLAAELNSAPATVYFAAESPVLRWYLRGLTTVEPADASLIVGTDVPPAGWLPANRVTLELAERLAFTADLSRPATLVSTLWKSLVIARAPAPLDSESIEILVRSPGPAARTEIIAPPPPSGRAAPSAPASSAVSGAATAALPASSPIPSPKERSDGR